MAICETLPVYKCSYDLMLKIMSVVNGFSKDYKYSLGERLRHEMLELLLDIYRANVSDDKRLNLERARMRVEAVRILVRLCKDTKIVGIQKFVELNVKIEEISKQLTGWSRSFIG